MDRFELNLGDVILDREGYPVVRHWGNSCDLFRTPDDLYKDAVRKFQVNEGWTGWSDYVDHRIETELAYTKGQSFPEGTQVVSGEIATDYLKDNHPGAFATLHAFEQAA